MLNGTNVWASGLLGRHLHCSLKSKAGYIMTRIEVSINHRLPEFIHNYYSEFLRFEYQLMCTENLANWIQSL